MKTWRIITWIKKLFGFRPESDKIVKRICKDKSFIKLIKEFSSKFPDLPWNCKYLSDCGKHSIVYMEKIMVDSGDRVHPTPVRVNNETGEIQVNGEILKKHGFDQTQLIYLLISTYCMKSPTIKDSEADIMAMKIFRKLGIKINPIQILDIFRRIAPLDEFKNILKHYRNDAGTGKSI